jgi:hypothetical protein
MSRPFKETGHYHRGNTISLRNLVLGLLSLDGGFDREVVQRIGYNDFEKIVLQDAQIYAMYKNRQNAEMPRR